MTHHEFLLNSANDWFGMAQECFEHGEEASQDPSKDRKAQMEYYHAFKYAIIALERYRDAASKKPIEYDIPGKFQYCPIAGVTSSQRKYALEKLQEYVRISSK